MGDFGGGIPGQVISELASIPKQVVETIASAGTAQATQPTATQLGGPPPGKNIDDGKAEAAKRRLAQVRGELQEYYERQKKKEEHEEVMAEEQVTQEKKQIEQSKKKQEEQQVLQRLSSQYGGTGEVAKSGN
ncbi:hypothetical protein HYU90_01360 [Candidatus Collierbacteria bacterium]|nr:hypothetical protein [Candidatus Collierbacteria bacterium]